MNQLVRPIPRLCAALALLGALGRPALANDTTAPATLSPPGAAEQAGPDWNAAPSPDAPERDPSRWYGKQILLVDAIGAGLLAYSVIVGDENVFVVGTATVLVGSPIVHGANHEFGNTLVSVPLRVLLPLAGAAIGLETLDLCGVGCNGPNFGGLVLGAALGVTAASIIDAAFLAHTRPRSRPDKSSPYLAPRLGVTGDGFSAGVGGTF